MLDYPLLQPYEERYAALPMEPLTIRAEMVPGSHLAGYDALCIDNLLARAVVMEATGGAGIPASSEPYRLPVPLRVLWRSEEGLPLYAATPMRPEGQSVSDTRYWHKRQQSGRWTVGRRGRFNIAPGDGRWMERRVPLPTTLARAWVANVVGNGEEMLRLLRLIHHIGKRRSNGYGEVSEWSVSAGPSFALVVDGALARSLPEAAAGLLSAGRPGETPTPVAWTPPQWLPGLWLPGWWAGSGVSIG